MIYRALSLSNKSAETLKITYLSRLLFIKKDEEYIEIKSFPMLLKYIEKGFKIYWGFTE